MVQHDDETLYTYAIQLGVVSRTTIKIIEIESNKTKLIMNYKFVLDGIQIILYPILKFLIPKWNEKVWVEDIPLKLRRQKVLSYNLVYLLRNSLEEYLLNLNLIGAFCKLRSS